MNSQKFDQTFSILKNDINRISELLVEENKLLDERVNNFCELNEIKNNDLINVYMDLVLERSKELYGSRVVGNEAEKNYPYQKR